MRIIETIHPNPQCRTFTCDQIISNVRLSELSSFYSREKPSDDAQVFFNHLQNIPLLENEMSIDKYSISLKIEPAFEDSESDWLSIRISVFYCLANFFKVDINDIEEAHSIKDDRKKFEEKVVDFYALSKMLSKVTIPHDFATHRDAWRGAIIDKLNSYSEISDPEGRYIYWKNELDKFDKAFDKLLALDLPQD